MMKYDKFYSNCVQACDRCKIKKRRCKPAQFDATKSIEFNSKCQLCQETNSKCTYDNPRLKRGRLRKEDKRKLEMELEKENKLQAKSGAFINYDKSNIHHLNEPKNSSLNLAGPNSTKSDMSLDFNLDRFSPMFIKPRSLSCPKFNSLDGTNSSGYDGYYSNYDSHSSPNSLNNKFQNLDLKFNEKNEQNDTFGLQADLNLFDTGSTTTFSYHNLISTAVPQPNVNIYADSIITPTLYVQVPSPDAAVKSRRQKLLLQITSIIFANNLIDISTSTFEVPNLKDYIAPLIDSNSYLALYSDEEKYKSKFSDFFLITLCLATLSGFFNSKSLKKHLLDPNFQTNYLDLTGTVPNDPIDEVLIAALKNVKVGTSGPTFDNKLGTDDNFSNYNSKLKLEDGLIIQIYELTLSFLTTFESDFDPTTLLACQSLLNFIKVVPNGSLN